MLCLILIVGGLLIMMGQHDRSEALFYYFPPGKSVSGTSLAFLALPGGLAARAGGAGVTMGAIRVTFWGALTMALTAGVGVLFGTVA